MDNTTEELISKYTCYICQMIFTRPIQISVCQHVFCKSCISNSIASQKEDRPSLSSYKCPLCRSDFMKKDIIRYNKLEKEIASVVITCQCGIGLALSDYNVHYEQCAKVKNSIEESIKRNVVKEVKSDVNRVTFNCTVCPLKNFDRKGLIKHVEQSHRHCTAVCPICVCQPWGDPNYRTYLYGHLQKRHMFDYDTTVDYSNDEDEILKKVLMESMNDK